MTNIQVVVLEQDNIEQTKTIFILKRDIKVKNKHFKSSFIIKAGSKCVPLCNHRSMIFMVQPFFDEEKSDEWIRHNGYKIYKKDVEIKNGNTE